MTSRNWREYGELFALSALVASLVLVGFEIRQTRLAIIAEANIARTTLGSDAGLAYADSQYLPPIDAKYAAEGLDALTPEERIRIEADAFAAKVRYDAYLFQYELGLLNEEFYKYYFFPGIRSWKRRWEELGMLSDANTRPSFKAAVNGVSEIPN